MHAIWKQIPRRSLKMATFLLPYESMDFIIITDYRATQSPGYSMEPVDFTANFLEGSILFFHIKSSMW